MQFEAFDRSRFGQDDGPRCQCCLFDGDSAIQHRAVMDGITGFPVFDARVFAILGGKFSGFFIKAGQRFFRNGITAQSHVPIARISIDKIAVYVFDQIFQYDIVMGISASIIAVAATVNFDFRVDLFGDPAGNPRDDHIVEHCFRPCPGKTLTACIRRNFRADVPFFDFSFGPFRHQADSCDDMIKQSIVQQSAAFSPGLGIRIAAQRGPDRQMEDKISGIQKRSVILQPSIDDSVYIGPDIG